MTHNATTGSGATFEALSDHGVVPVITIDRIDDAERLGEALTAGGLPCAEVTFRTPGAADALRLLARAFPEMLVGAGTVFSVEQAEVAVAAGARFIVSPVLDDAVVEWCRSNDVPVAPGVMTPNEIAAAASHGLSLVKFFPAAAAGGPAALEAIASVFPELRFIPTGGIGLENLNDYLRLPMVAACGGSWPAPRRLIRDGDFDTIQRLAATTVATVRATRSES
jgi:2-dehydro-3-deoxyphosphogluconate aldolase/(4S)-4-hydroxy-2-oxoglutarate aldolase